MNYLKNYFWRFMRKLYIKKRIDFLVEYKKVKRIEKKEIGSSNIIVAPFTFDNTHLFEAIYARKSMLEGVNVFAFLCGQGVHCCEKKGNGTKYKQIKCELCFQAQRDFVSQFGVKPCFVKNELTRKDKALITSYIDDYFKNESNPPLFMGVDVAKILLSALQRYYFEAEPTVKRNNITTGFLETIISTLIVFDKLCNRVNPEYVLVSHGTYSSWGSIVEYCRIKGVQVVVWGRVYNKWGIYFANNESYLTEMVQGSNDEWQNKDLTDEQRKRILDFLELRTGQGRTEFLYDYNKNQKRQLSRTEICNKLGIPSEAKIVGMFPNIPWDGSVTGVSEAFSSYREWLATTIDFFRNKEDVYLLIRTHPAEKAVDAEIGKETLNTLVNQLFDSLPPNVIVLPANSKINSFAVGRASEFGVFYCSTVGMELTYLNVPLICAGPSPLRNKKIVYDAKNRVDYLELLEQGILNGLKVTEEMRDNLIKFCYYNTFTRVMPETFVEFEEANFRRLLFDNEKFIEENEILDYLFNVIGDNKEYDFDKFYSK